LENTPILSDIKERIEKGTIEKAGGKATVTSIHHPLFPA
jgi:hypothetical protein